MQNSDGYSPSWANFCSRRSLPGLDKLDHRFNSFFALNINIKIQINYYNNLDVPLLIIIENHCLSIIIDIFTKNKEKSKINKK